MMVWISSEVPYIGLQGTTGWPPGGRKVSGEAGDPHSMNASSCVTSSNYPTILQEYYLNDITRFQ